MRRPDRDGRARPSRRHHAVHPDGRDGARIARGGARAAKCRGSVRHRPGSVGASRHARSMYGAFTSNVDMRSGAPAFGTPENAKANIASGQLARRYRLPYRTSNASASNAADAQGAYETEMSLWGAILGHGNLVYHAAGWQEGGLTASLREAHSRCRDAADDDRVPEAHRCRPSRSLASRPSKEWQPAATSSASRIPLERYEHAFYRPLVSNWQNYENWQIAGGKDATQRATDFGSRRSRITRSRRWIPPFAKHSMPMSRSGEPKSARVIHEITRPGRGKRIVRACS